MKQKIILLLCLFLLLAFLRNANYANSSSSTPPSGMTGAPGTSSTCTSCHSPGSGGDGFVNITFNGGSNQYTSGQTYTMSVTVSQTGQKRWGFSMVARNSANQNTGTWIPTNTDSKVYSSSTHIGHKNAPNNVPDTYTFTFSWVAPVNAGVGNVTFYVVGNAANGNNNSTGDYIYYNTLTISEFVPQPTVHLRLLLQGALASDTGMNTILQTNGHLPQLQPYNSSPWNYNGDEAVQELPSNATDWVLLEARNATNDSLVVARKAALLLNDGTIQDVNCNTGVTFEGIAAGNYYITVKHRNHLSVITQLPLSLPNNNCPPDSPCDLTNFTNVRNGNATLVNLSGGKWALPCGDIDHNGVITFADYNAWKAAISILPGYSPADVNLNGQVDIADFSSFRNNLGKSALPLVR